MLPLYRGGKQRPEGEATCPGVSVRRRVISKDLGPAASPSHFRLRDLSSASPFTRQRDDWRAKKDVLAKRKLWEGDKSKAMAQGRGRLGDLSKTKWSGSPRRCVPSRCVPSRESGGSASAASRHPTSPLPLTCQTHSLVSCICKQFPSGYQRESWISPFISGDGT